MHAEWDPILAFNFQVSKVIQTNYCSLLSWFPWTHNCNFRITADKKTVIVCCFNLYDAVCYWLLCTALFRVLTLLTSRVDTWPIDLQKKWIWNHPFLEGKQLPNPPTWNMTTNTKVSGDYCTVYSLHHSFLLSLATNTLCLMTCRNNFFHFVPDLSFNISW